MRCKEALRYWQRELMGQTVDSIKLEEAFAHINSCEDLCARTLSAAPDTDFFSKEEMASGAFNLLKEGRKAEKQGDKYALEYSLYKRETDRIWARTAWQAAANYFGEALQYDPANRFAKAHLRHIKLKSKHLHQ